ncbi:integrase [Caldalkalibacillus uzonensis]|uniref:Integrase n=1 Tax=Caldalkalibacillus uzonensis TaxID=353224 RepID=A0ABU0CV68_9BACI|nr:site-specific integrase [Caldalkalibacillus uzonensis]MDQ0340229.1 integrase [Caldalkalibacillus uzonensis]
MARGYVQHVNGNKWRLFYDVGMKLDPKTGKMKRQRKTKTVQAKGKREAEKLLADFITELNSDNYFEPEKMMFVDFVQNEWLPKHAKKHLSKTALDTHIRLLELRILPAFQHFRLDQIKPIHIIDFLHNLGEEGMNKKGGSLSPSTIFYHYRILNNIFNFALECQLLKESPLKGVKKPKIKEKEIEVYSEEEAYKLLECLESEESLSWKVFIKLAITTGLRRSELLGLEWKHVDLDEGTISVKQGLTYTPTSGYVIGELKTKGSKRTVSIPESLMNDLKRLKLQKQEERLAAEELWNEEYFFVFSSWNGKPLNPTSVKNWWQRFIKRHGLKYINFHALRHTSATLLINQGVHAKVISERLGHSDIKTTMNTYGHVLRKADREAANKFDALLKKKG